MPKRKNKEYDRINRFDWKKVIDWKFPFKTYTLSDPNYIKARDKLFDLNGNGWWWNDGKGLNENAETSKEYNLRKRKEKENNNEHADRV